MSAILVLSSLVCVHPCASVANTLLPLRILRDSVVNRIMTDELLSTLRKGVAIPAMPLALNAQRKLDERRQRAPPPHYIAAGGGGIAAGVHTTQFAIRDPRINLFKPVLQ